MADSSVARGRIGGPDFFADDDPLAELARIAGYEDKAVAPATVSPLVRREPSFNLEDELLREFEQYEEPRSEPVAPVAAVAARVVEPELPVARAEMARAETDPFADFEPAVQAPLMTRVPSEEVQQPFSPVNDWSVRAEPELARTSEPQPVLSAAAMPVAAPEADLDFGGLDADLIAELETSITSSAVPPMAGRTSPRGAYEPGFRMPLTNFVVAPPRTQGERAELDLEREAGLEPPREPVASTWATNFAADVAAVRARPVAPAAIPAVTPAPVAEVAPSVEPVFAQPTAEVRSLQNELAQVFEKADERFEAPHVEPVLSAAPAAPLISELRSEPSFAPMIDRDVVVEQSAPVAAEPTPDLMDDDFELMLDDLELDLADLMQDEKPSVEAVATAPRPDPVVEAVVGAAPAAFVPRTQPVPTLAPEIPAFLAQSRHAPDVGKAAATLEPAPLPAAPAVPEQADSDAFDPTLLADAEEMPEAVPDLDVPEIPVHEPEKPVAPPSDFDLDLDSELASYLDTAGMSQRSVQAQTAAKPQDRSVSRATATAAAPAAVSAMQNPVAASVNPKVNDGLDDFERALEEDFRRSLAQPLRPTPVDEAYADDEAPVYETRRSLAAFAMPLSVAGFVAIVGISAYAWYATGKSSGGADGSPVVIAADSEPVKVVPENPGGKIVPNQDKAVYDRVASGSLNDPKQPSLISSEEQPVDVVQKTLTPENFPLQGEDEAQADMTPVGETQDARLLPSDGQAKPPADAEQLAVMPRRVKTMIVRPDGTLVEQVTEVPAAKPVNAPATAVTTEKIPAAPALAEPTQLAATGAASSTAPTNLSDVNVARTTALTGATDVVAPAASTAPAGVPAPKAPVPTARPANQPVEVVASVTTQGNVRNELRPASTPAVAPAAAAPVTAASATPAPAQAAQSGGYFIQIASLPSEADAQKSYRNLSSKFAGVIGGRGMDIAKAEIAGKGTFYRVRIAAGSTRDEAAALCERYRAAGGTCLIAR
ncbi:SPOR domain-containing protein [Allorhizobium pseudoryzae]|uniref:SPOR domain-containing protein n=1 Tax=Allorhizobium pseudoryzae TaxID=379684 RepID=UPI003D073A47